MGKMSILVGITLIRFKYFFLLRKLRVQFTTKSLDINLRSLENIKANYATQSNEWNDCVDTV